MKASCKLHHLCATTRSNNCTRVVTRIEMVLQSSLEDPSMGLLAYAAAESADQAR